MTIYITLLLSSFCAAFGQIFLKKGADNISTVDGILNLHLLLGTLLYIVGFILWVYSLSKVSLTVVYGFTLLTFIGVFLLSNLVLGEKISAWSMGGIITVMLGFALILKGQAA